MKQKLLLILAAISFSCYAQETATTTNGKQVIINTDGTWSYIETTEQQPITNKDGGSQLKKVTSKPIEQIGKVQQFGRSVDAEITKSGNLYIVSYKDSKYKTIDTYRSFSFEGENTLNDLYLAFEEGFKTIPKEDMMFELPETYIWLHFERFLGAAIVTISSTSGKHASDDVYVSLQISKKNIETLFGKRK